MTNRTVRWRSALQPGMEAGAGIADFAPSSGGTALENVTLRVASGRLAERNSSHCRGLKSFILKIKKTLKYTVIINYYADFLWCGNKNERRQEHSGTVGMMRSGVSDGASLVPAL